MVAMICSLISVAVIVFLTKTLVAINVWMFHLDPIASCVILSLNIMLLKRLTLMLLEFNRDLARYEWRVLSLL